jgi:hypothetical protein
MVCTIAMASNWENVNWYGCETTLTLQIQTPYTSKGDLLYKPTTVRIHPAFLYIMNTPEGSNTTLSSSYDDAYAWIYGYEGTTEVFLGEITFVATVNTDVDATSSGKAHHDNMRLFGVAGYGYSLDYYSGAYPGILQLTCESLVLNDNASNITTTISASGCTLAGGVNSSSTDVTIAGYTFTGTLSPCTMTPDYIAP